MLFRSNGRSNIHDDAYMTDTYRGRGPLGVSMRRTSRFTGGGVCGSVTFSGSSRLFTVCIQNGGADPFLKVLDPDTLEQIASLQLPPRPLSGNIYQDFTGGGYFYLDKEGRAALFTADHRISLVALVKVSGHMELKAERDYDLSPVLAPDDKGTSLLPDWAGRIWFVTLAGVVGVVEPLSGAIHTLEMGEEIENSFAVDETGGVYIATDVAMYRFEADGSGVPVVVWREVYQNSGIVKPSQVNAGTGTTPTLLGTEWVAITDNADPMNVVVYRRAKTVTGSRVV